MVLKLRIAHLYYRPSLLLTVIHLLMLSSARINLADDHMS